MSQPGIRCSSPLEVAPPVNSAVEAGMAHSAGLYDVAPVACATLARDGSITQANLACARLLGRSPAQLDGGQLAPFVALADQRAFSDWLERVFESATLQRCQLALDADAGPPRTVQIDAQRSPDGHHCHAALLDLTDALQAHSALQARESRYERVVRGISDGLWGRDLVTGEVYLSARCEALLGFGAGELQAGPDPIASRVHPDDRERREAAVQAHMARREPYDVEARLRMKDGSYRWFRSCGQAEWSAQGEPLRMAGAISDITRTRQAEAALRDIEVRFRATFEQAAVGLAHVAPDGHWMLINQKLCDIVGYSSDEMKRLSFQDITHPDDLDSDQALVQRLLAGQIASYAIEKRYLHKGGHAVWVELTVSLVCDAAGAPNHFIAVINDISVRKQVQEALHDSNQALEAANRELSRSNAELEQFAYVASHDLIEPLRTVSSCVQLLQKRYGGTLDARADDFINHAVAGSQRMQALIDDLLAYSKVGAAPRAVGATSSAAALELACANLAKAIEDSSAHISHDELPRVNANPGELTQILQNLVGNALKFRGAGPAMVHVSARRMGDEWVFSVADQGIGIEPQYFSRIFRQFQRLHTREEYAGTGMGLSICQKIVERQGGRIWVESAAGHGATFFFTLPAAEPSTSREP